MRITLTGIEFESVAPSANLRATSIQLPHLTPCMQHQPFCQHEHHYSYVQPTTHSLSLVNCDRCIARSWTWRACQVRPSTFKSCLTRGSPGFLRRRSHSRLHHSRQRDWWSTTTGAHVAMARPFSVNPSLQQRFDSRLLVTLTARTRHGTLRVAGGGIQTRFSQWPTAARSPSKATSPTRFSCVSTFHGALLPGRMKGRGRSRLAGRRSAYQ